MMFFQTLRGTTSVSDLRFKQTGGSRLLIFSHTKLETGAVIKSRKYCTVPVEETDVVALPCRLRMQLLNHDHFEQT